MKAGDLGGYIESENNLAHDGHCWVYDNAIVCNDAVVRDNASIHGSVELKQAARVLKNACVFGGTKIYDYAVITDHARVGCEWDGTQDEQGQRNASAPIIRENVKISGHARVIGEVYAGDNAKIKGNAKVEGKWPGILKDKQSARYITNICDNAVIEGNANVLNVHASNNAHIYENASIQGHPTMGGHVTVKGNAQVCGDAIIIHNAVINGDARIGGTANITDKVSIGHNADMKETGDFLRLKDLGNASYAVRNKNSNITVVHKGRAYNGLDEFKIMNEMPDDKILNAVRQIEDHFTNQMAEDLEAGLKLLDMGSAQMGQ